jgi:prepilin-type processing-associated H-X9-DG protein
MPKSGVPDMYQSIARYKGAEVPTSDKERWRPEYGALWPYMGGSSLGPVGTPAPPLPPMGENMAKRYMCQVDSPGFERTYSDMTLGNGAITLQRNAAGAGVVAVGPGSPGYWSYSVNSVVNSLGRFRNRFNAGQLPWSDPIKEVNIKTPPNFIVFIEEDNASLFNDEVFDAPAYSQGDMLTNRHQKGGNVGFLDAHVELFNQTLFNEVPSGISGTYVSHSEAMASPITRMFFPDGGNFANGF